MIVSGFVTIGSIFDNPLQINLDMMVKLRRVLLLCVVLAFVCSIGNTSCQSVEADVDDLKTLEMSKIDEKLVLLKKIASKLEKSEGTRNRSQKTKFDEYLMEFLREEKSRSKTTNSTGLINGHKKIKIDYLPFFTTTVLKDEVIVAGEIVTLRQYQTSKYRRPHFYADNYENKLIACVTNKSFMFLDYSLTPVFSITSLLALKPKFLRNLKGRDVTDSTIIVTKKKTQFTFSSQTSSGVTKKYQRLLRLD